MSAAIYITTCLIRESRNGGIRDKDERTNEKITLIHTKLCKWVIISLLF